MNQTAAGSSSHLCFLLVTGSLAVLILLGSGIFWGSGAALSASANVKVADSGTQRPLQGSPTAAPGCSLAWGRVTSPNAGTGSNFLNGVAAVAANDVWAVGYAFSGQPLRSHALLEHWDGTSWTIVPRSVPGTSSRLSGIAARTAADIWAVGAYMNGATSLTLVLHWDGNGWTQLSGADVPRTDNSLEAVTIFAANDVWAVGYTGDFATATHVDCVCQVA